MKPTTLDDALHLLDGCFLSAAFGAALELGLFWILAEESMDERAVSEALGVPGRRCAYWLRYLERAGLLESVDGRFTPSSSAKSAILDTYSRDTWAFLAGEARDRLPAVRDLPRHIVEPGSAWAAQGLTPPSYIELMRESPERSRRFTRMLYELHADLAEEIAGTLDMGGVARLMDLGGGSGVVSLALLREHPGLAAVVVDIENVCAAGKEIAAEERLGDRIEYRPVDFLSEELPGGFDMVLECDVCVHGEKLYQKIFGALKPGGRFVIIDQLSPDDGVAPPGRLHWAFQNSMIDPDFRYTTEREVREWLVAAGFRIEEEGATPSTLKTTDWHSSPWTFLAATRPA